MKDQEGFELTVGNTEKFVCFSYSLNYSYKEKMSCLPKPVLRGHIAKKGIKNLIGALTFSAINCSLYYFFVAVPREKKYHDFLKTYDAEAHFKDLDKWGYLNYRSVLAEATGSD